MKKLLVFLAALAVSLPSVAQVRDSQVFDHLALGVSAGIDGLGIEVAMPASPYLQIRGGYSFFPFSINNTANLGKVNFEDTFQLDLSNVPFSVSPWVGGLGKVLLDIYPSKRGPFHFVAGAFFGSGRMLGVKADLRNAIDPIDYTTGYGINDFSISTDKDGYAYLDAAVGKVLPYLGIGTGRAVKLRSRVSATLEVGAVYTGGIKIVGYNYSFDPEGETSVATSKDLVMDGKQLDEGMVDKLAAFPILPMLKFGIYVRLF